MQIISHQATNMAYAILLLNTCCVLCNPEVHVLNVPTSCIIIWYNRTHWLFWYCMCIVMTIFVVQMQVDFGFTCCLIVHWLALPLSSSYKWHLHVGGEGGGTFVGRCPPPSRYIWCTLLPHLDPPSLMLWLIGYIIHKVPQHTLRMWLCTIRFSA